MKDPDARLMFLAVAQVLTVAAMFLGTIGQVEGALFTGVCIGCGIATAFQSDALQRKRREDLGNMNYEADETEHDIRRVNAIAEQYKLKAEKLAHAGDHDGYIQSMGVARDLWQVGIDLRRGLHK